MRVVVELLFFIDVLDKLVEDIIYLKYIYPFATLNYEMLVSLAGNAP